jgi:hypothetical protein
VAERLTRNRVRCGACKQEIESSGQHHLVTCQCGQTFVDGGLAYNRVGYGTSGYDDLCEYEKKADSAEREGRERG